MQWPTINPFSPHTHLAFHPHPTLRPSLTPYIIFQSKARVSGQTALASLRECVADKKVGGRAKQALKDLTMHR